MNIPLRPSVEGARAIADDIKYGASLQTLK